MDFKLNKVNKPIFELNFSSLVSIILVLFVGLKLGGIINWSWWWVLSPIWLPWVLFFCAWLVIWVMAHLLLKGFNKYNKSNWK